MYTDEGYQPVGTKVVPDDLLQICGCKSGNCSTNANADCRIFHAHIYAAATTTIARTLIQAAQLNMMTEVKMNLAVTKNKV